MAIDNRTLDILIRTLADTKGVDEAKSKLNELKSTTTDVSTSASALGTAIGLAIPLGFVATLSAVISKWQEFEAEEQRVFDEMERGRETVLGLQQALLSATDAMREMALIKALPLAQGVTAATQEVIKLKTEQSLLNLSTKEGIDAYKEYTTRIQAATSLRDQLVKGQERERDALKQTEDQTFLNNSAGNEEVQIQQRVAQAYDQKLKSLLAARVPEEQAKQAAQVYAESVRHAAEVRASAGAEVSNQERLTALMREQTTILQNIRQQQTLINANPFMSVDAQQAALLQTYTQEMQTLQGVMAVLQAQKASGLLDPVQLAQVNQKLQQTNFEIQLMQLKVVGLQQPMRTELANWVNQWGTASHQISGLIQNQIGSALQSMNHYLVTGQGNVKELLAHFAEMGLTVVEQIAIQQAASLLGITTTTAASTGAAATTATAWAPAAAATSVGSFGSSATIGAAAAIAAIAAIMGALVLHEGGAVGGRRIRRMHSGGLASNEQVIIAEDDEVMIRKEVARQPGMTEFLLALNAGMFHTGGLIPRMHEGGEMGNWYDYIMAGLNTPGFQPNVYAGAPGQGPGGWSPPGDLDQGPQVIIPTDQGDRDAPGWVQQSERGGFLSNLYGNFAGFGTNPWGGFGAFGPTLLSTNWVNYPGVGFVPMAVPLGPTAGDYGIYSTRSHPHTPPRHEAHTGGLISRFHSGGSIGNFRLPRLHGGGGMPASSSNRPQLGGQQIHIFALTDVKELSRRVAGSTANRKIVFDTINGRRIDLGL